MLIKNSSNHQQIVSSNQQIKQAIVLAGGFGTRLRSVVQDVPKPMASVANRPFLEYIMNYLVENNFEKVVLAIGYLGEVVQNHFGDTYKGMTVEYAVEASPLGTGGGILNATATCSDEPILVLNGDTFFNVDFEKFRDFYFNKNAAIAFGLKPMTDFERYGTVELTNEKITQFKEKQYQKSGLINGGVYILRKAIFIEKGFSVGQKFSFEADFLEKFVADLVFYGFVSDTYFIDIGIPEDFAKAQVDFKS